MPKDQGGRSISRERNNLRSPYQREKESPASSRKSSEPPPSDADIKEWEEARCPVCMEHPHNAVLLLCSSHNNGCRPFMCNTSYRHSNCLDQFCKASSTKKSDEKCLDILCPLCRGTVKNWTVVSSARTFMNSKSRDCSLESCKFMGTYGELRKHARTEHSTMRPADADPERQRDWMRMERQRDIGDLLSTIQPLFVDGADEEELGASVFMSPPFLISLYVRIPQHQDEGANGQLHPRLVISFGPRNSETTGVQTRSQRRPRPQWGEIVDGHPSVIQIDDDDDDGNDDEHVYRASTSRRHRRRWMRMSDEEDVI